MTVQRETTPQHTRSGPSWVGFTEWLLGIAGGIATFLGFFILFAGENQYVGIGGDWSWRVGDISSAWAYGLLIGGLAAVLIALGLVFFGPKAPRVRQEAGDLAALLWHAGIFVVVNAFIWLQDIAIGGGLDYALWVTIPWGVGLVVHGLLYYFRGRRPQPQERLVRDQPREPLPH